MTCILFYQIGTRDRKPGRFGGCFISEDSIVIARPGLRLWISATDGKVCVENDGLTLHSVYYYPAGSMLNTSLLQFMHRILSQASQLRTEMISFSHNN